MKSDRNDDYAGGDVFPVERLLGADKAEERTMSENAG